MMEHLPPNILRRVGWHHYSTLALRVCERTGKKRQQGPSHYATPYLLLRLAAPNLNSQGGRLTKQPRRRLNLRPETITNFIVCGVFAGDFVPNGAAQRAVERTRGSAPHRAK
jgi:hypothetical protein